MRILSHLTATACVLLLAAASASAFEARQSARNSTTVNPGDTVTVDVFFDATDVGIKLMTIGVLFDPVVFTYDDVASNALPIVYPAPPTSYGTNGGQPGYILYAAGAGGMPPVPATALYPQQTPPQFPSWQLWVSPPPGLEQINLNFAEGNITDEFDTQVTGDNIWIAGLVLEVNNNAPNGTSNIDLCNDCSPAFIQIGDTILDSSEWTVGPDIVVTVPEPAAAMLAVGALAGVAVLGTRRNRRR